MKKIFSTVLAIIIIFNIGVVVQATGMNETVEISSVSALPGEIVEVFISIQCPDGIKTLSFLDFEYDNTALTIVEEECAWLVQGEISDIDFENNASIITFNDNTAHSGNILKLVFQVSEEAENCNLPINCEVIGTRMVDNIETEISISTTSGAINVVVPLEGKMISGNVTSYLSETDVVTLILTSVENSEVSYSAEVTGNNAEYSFENIEAGEYTLSVLKNKHVTRTYQITVTDEDVTQDVKIHPLGDVNGDGRVNTIDTARANAHARGVLSISGYEFECLDVNGDGKINTIDVARVNAHARGVTTLW